MEDKNTFTSRGPSPGKIDGYIFIINIIAILPSAYYLHESQSLNPNKKEKNKSMPFNSIIVKYNKYTINNNLF